MELIRITADKEKARNILKMVSLIEERMMKQDRKKMAALIISDYYEIIKEIITAILLIEGYKTLSQKDLIEYIKLNHKKCTMHEISILDNLRVMRNRVAYEGFFIEPSYLDRNEASFRIIIGKLKNLTEKKLK